MLSSIQKIWFLSPLSLQPLLDHEEPSFRDLFVVPSVEDESESSLPFVAILSANVFLYYPPMPILDTVDISSEKGAASSLSQEMHNRQCQGILLVYARNPTCSAASVNRV